jgi:hypothetical protein
MSYSNISIFNGMRFFFDILYHHLHFQYNAYFFSRRWQSVNHEIPLPLWNTEYSTMHISPSTWNLPPSSSVQSPTLTGHLFKTRYNTDLDLPPAQKCNDNAAPAPQLLRHPCNAV